MGLSSEEQVYRGWPLLVDVGVSHPDGWKAAHEGRTLAPLKLIPASGGWDSLVKVRFIGPQRSEVTLPLVPVFHPEGALVMDAKAHSFMLRWSLGPEQTRALPPGPYVAIAQLEVPFGAQQGGWTGRVDSLAVRFEVLDEPTPCPPEQAEAKALEFARYEVYRGDSSAALAILDAHLAAWPDSVSALAFKAGLLESAGDLEGAYALYGQALTLHFQKFPDAREPPVELMGRARSLRERLNQEAAP